MRRKIKFHYFYNGKIGSWLIRARIASPFSHCGVEFEDGSFYHAAFGKGCVSETLSDQPHHPLASTTILVDDEHYDAALTVARSMVGKEYDLKGIIGFILVKKFQDDDQYFCSEYGRIIFEAATGYSFEHFSLVTPNDLRLLTESYRAIAEK